MLSASQIRQQFIDFFVQKHGHKFVPSSSVVPLDDPTLLFANAGMNQFKPIFLGLEKRDYVRAANTQKCIRAGGKHNDLDDVGKDTYHHTFFEMLGNWSFGDYFKQEAIEWAWELLTDVWKLDKTRLHVTVFEGDPANGIPRDEEAAGFWKSVGVPEDHIHLGNKKDNFWEMGETGPCGPCTEVHIDRTPDKSGGKLVNAGTADVIEIWNLVFIQFNRNPDKSLTPLPAKHVDTGMGFERICSVIQNKTSNYDTDVFTPIFDAIQKITAAPKYTGILQDLKDTAYRVIADHIRTLTFALTDGATIGNDGRNYVLKRILRRAERYGRQYLGANKPFLCDLVDVVIQAMGESFPELKRSPAKVIDQIRSEELAFIRTLDKGIKWFSLAADRAKSSGSNIIHGQDAFQLHDTYGLLIDITQQMAEEVGLKVDYSGYLKALEDAKNRSREGSKKFAVTAIKGELPKTDDSPKYTSTQVQAKVCGWVKDDAVITSGELQAGEQVALLLDQTCFYAEQGGQVGDTGSITAKGIDFEVEDTQRLGDSVLHVGTLLEGTLKVGQVVQVSLNPRLDTMKNHTATHMLNYALRQVLGEHVDQKGSLVDAEKTRFDFAHDKALSPQEIRQIETLVNDQIQQDLPVTAQLMPLSEAKKLPGVRAVFGEKYPDPVRVVSIGTNLSTEFCGGTHLERSSQAGLFKIISQEPVSKGVRRITAVTGPKAVETVLQMSGVLEDLTGRMNCKIEDLPTRIETLQEEVKKLQKQLQKGLASDLNSAADQLLAKAIDVKGSKIIAGELPTASVEQMRGQIDRLRTKAGSAMVVLIWQEEGKIPILVGLSDDLVQKGLSASEMIKPIAQALGGSGGGKRPDMAQAGGKDPTKIAEALKKAVELGTTLLNQ